jgi:hypothetical protein
MANDAIPACGRGGSDGPNAVSEIRGSRTPSRKITHGAPALHPFWLAASNPSYVRKPLTLIVLLRMSSQTVLSSSHSRPLYAQRPKNGHSHRRLLQGVIQFTRTSSTCACTFAYGSIRIGRESEPAFADNPTGCFAHITHKPRIADGVFIFLNFPEPSISSHCGMRRSSYPLCQPSEHTERQSR